MSNVENEWNENLKLNRLIIDSKKLKFTNVNNPNWATCIIRVTWKIKISNVESYKIKSHLKLKSSNVKKIYKHEKC